MTKFCHKCNRELSHEEFYKCRRAKDGLQSKCKQCLKKYNEKNKERIKKYQENYRKKNKRKMKEYNKKYREVNGCHLNKQSLERYYRNKEERSEKQRQYYIENKKEIKERSREYYSLNKERVIESNKEWQNKNKDRLRIYQNRRRYKVNNLPSDLTHEEWKSALEYFGNKCAYCSSDEKLEQDHFIPLIKGGGYTADNIVPSCRSCNSRKHTKLFGEWYPNDEAHSVVREQKILRYLKLTKRLEHA